MSTDQLRVMWKVLNVVKTISMLIIMGKSIFINQIDKHIGKKARRAIISLLLLIFITSAWGASRAKLKFHEQVVTEHMDQVKEQLGPETKYNFKVDSDHYPFIKKDPNLMENNKNRMVSNHLLEIKHNNLAFTAMRIKPTMKITVGTRMRRSKNTVIMRAGYVFAENVLPADLKLHVATRGFASNPHLQGEVLTTDDPLLTNAVQGFDVESIVKKLRDFKRQYSKEVALFIEDGSIGLTISPFYYFQYQEVDSEDIEGELNLDLDILKSAVVFLEEIIGGEGERVNAP